MAEHPSMPAEPVEPGIRAAGEPFGCVAGVMPDMTPDQVAKLLPALQRGKNASGAIFTTPPPAAACVVEFNSLDGLDEIEIGFPGDVARAWGAGERTAGGTVYTNAARTLRATLDTNRILKISPLVPLATQLPELFVLVGKPIAEVEALYVAKRLPPDQYTKPPHRGYRLPATEWTARPRVDFNVNSAGTIGEISVSMYFDDAGAESAIRAALAQQYGRPRGDQYGPVRLQMGDRRATLIATARR